MIIPAKNLYTTTVDMVHNHNQINFPRWILPKMGGVYTFDHSFHSVDLMIEAGVGYNFDPAKS
jgi:hypothetical protein